MQIISQKDEHCWVGELNGLRGEASVWRRGGPGSETRSPPVAWRRASSAREPTLTRAPASPTGWFPAKFVEVLDERSKEVRGRTRHGCPWELLPPPQPWRVLASGSGREDGEGVAGHGRGTGASQTLSPTISIPSRGTML